MCRTMREICSLKQGALLSLEVMKQQAMGHHHHPPDYYASHARQMHHVSKGVCK